ncbi:MAG: helix-turn-helix domain-containing protein [Cytophagaceae bacterium]
MELLDRIRQIIELYGYSPSLFADEISVQRSGISHILSGRNKPSLEFIQKVLNRFPEIDPNWLLTGKGTMKQLNIFGGVDKIEDDNEVKPKKTEQPMSKKPESSEKSLPSPENKNITNINTKEASTPEPEEEKKKSIPDNILPILPPNGKKIEKIIVFYDDKTFGVYTPE